MLVKGTPTSHFLLTIELLPQQADAAPSEQQLDTHSPWELFEESVTVSQAAHLLSFHQLLLQSTQPAGLHF